MAYRINKQPKYLLCVKVSSPHCTFLSLFVWMGSETRCSQHWSCYLVSLSDLLVCKQDTETSALKILFESTRTGFVVLKFYSFKVKNKDKEVCFDSIKGICWFICSLWFGWNVWSSVFFCVAIYVVSILDILCLYEIVVLMSYFQTWFMENNCAFLIFFFFLIQCFLVVWDSQVKKNERVL